jgi:hypothetical protein
VCEITARAFAATLSCRVAHPTTSPIEAKSRRAAPSCTWLAASLRLAAPLFGLLSFAAWGQVPVDLQPITWSCQTAVNPRPAFVCVESTDAGAVQPSELRIDPPPASYTADLFASGAGANITRLTRTRPDVYGGRAWAVPLFSPIIDEALGRQLAASVMCGREPLCTVEVLPTVAPSQRAAQAPERLSFPWARARR